MTIGDAIWKIFRVCFWLLVMLGIGEPHGFIAWVAIIGGCLGVIDVLAED